MIDNSNVSKLSVGVQAGRVRVDFHDENETWLALDPSAAAYLGMKLMQAAYDLEPAEMPVPPRHRFIFEDGVYS